MILMKWLFQDELIFEPLVKGLADIITRKSDRYLLLGWCILVRALADYDDISSQSNFSGIFFNFCADNDLRSVVYDLFLLLWLRD